MSEFKVGDYVLRNDGFYNVLKVTRVNDGVADCIRRVDGEPRYSSFKFCDLRHATPEEIAAGHRIDKPSNPRELETLDKPENHISPNCKTIGEQS
ncbi:hypothetical protein LLI22_000190 [Acinetobacter baumannii]|uniref:hypothetical protein n=1 Tax=Acinetobacter baumannii TaxID=470 RepID=UPI001DF7B0E8|nr:hypothetical protein [Acinetobacter baumannii]EHZ7942084.1 hypothetical protein [Acinetobacter baumannii]EKU8073834.1 hypothetical protein [Acinetobacter baumannii]EKV2719973.1 hypothetical protein [Acinetobacter baumannii]